MNSSDSRTAHGNNLKKISMKCKEETLTSIEAKQNMKYCQIPPGEEWRVDIAKELFQLRADSEISKHDRDNLDQLLNLLMIT